MYCKYCGAEIDPNDTCCRCCGRSVHRSNPQNSGSGSNGSDRNNSNSSIVVIVAIVAVLLLAVVGGVLKLHIDDSGLDIIAVFTRTTSEVTKSPIATTTAISGTSFVGRNPYSQVYFSGAQASSELYSYQTKHSYPASNAIDGKTSTSWQEGASGDGIGETLTLYFDRTQSVSMLSFRIGYASKDEWYYNNNRPCDVEISFSNGEYFYWTFNDSNSEQMIELSHSVYTDWVEITIDSVYQGSMHGSMQDTCISEVCAYD